MTEIEVAWAAGFIEGEGCFSLHKPKARRNTISASVIATSTDKDVLEKLEIALGVGHISGPYQKQGNRKPCYSWAVQNHKDIFSVLIMVMPYLGKRRLAKASELLTFIESKVCK